MISITWSRTALGWRKSAPSVESEGLRPRLDHFCKHRVSLGLGGPQSPPAPQGRRAAGYLHSLLLWGPVRSLDRRAKPGASWLGLPTDAYVASRARVRHSPGRGTWHRQAACAHCPARALTFPPWGLGSPLLPLCLIQFKGLGPCFLFIAFCLISVSPRPWGPACQPRLWGGHCPQSPATQHPTPRHPAPRPSVVI